MKHVSARRRLAAGLSALAVALVAAQAAPAQTAPDADRMLALAAADAQWVAQTSADTLTAEASLAEPPGPAHPLARGFNTRQQVDMSQSEIDRTMDELAATGSGLHRLLVYWADVQPDGPNDWRWSAYDAVVESAAARGLRLVLAPTGSPNWARTPDRRTDPADVWHPFPYPDDLHAWDVFIGALARRYATHAYAFHIWNEPNIVEFWQARQHWAGRRPSPSGWKELYCRAARRIKVEAPGALVGTGGLGPITGQGKNWQAGRFLKRAFAAGLGACWIDFVAYHPYLIRSYCDGSNPPLDGLLPTYRQLRRMRGVMVEYGLADRPMWNTEWGFPSATCDYTEERQAELIPRQYAFERSLPYLSHAIYFNPRDGASSDLWGFIGVLRFDWSRKPAFDAVASLP